MVLYVNIYTRNTRLKIIQHSRTSDADISADKDNIYNINLIVDAGNKNDYVWLNF